MNTTQDSKLQVWFFIGSFFPEPRGAGYAALYLARELRKQGVEVSFVTNLWKDGAFARETFDGFPVYAFPFLRPGKVRKILTFIRYCRFAKQHGQQLDWFHLHGGTYISLFLARWTARLTGCRTLLKITLDGWDTPKELSQARHGRAAGRWYRKLDAVVAMTSGQGAKVKEWQYPGTLQVIPNGVDTQRFTPVSAEAKKDIRKSIGLPESVPVLIFSGCMEPRKGIDVMLGAWQILIDKNPDLHLVVVGNFLDEEGQKEALNRFLTERGIDPVLLNDERILDVGLTDEPERYFRAADVFVFPSRGEGFGTVQIEAMACGLPCVVHDIEGVTGDIFPDPSVGIRLKNNTPEAFAGEIQALLDRPDQRAAMGEAAARWVQQAFCIDRVAGRYLDVYRGQGSRQ